MTSNSLRFPECKKKKTEECSLHRFMRAQLGVLGQRVVCLLKEILNSKRTLAIMAAAMWLFIAANVEYFASFLISAFFLPLFFMLLTKSDKELPTPTKMTKASNKMDSPPIDKKSVPKKLNKKTTAKKRKNRGLPGMSHKVQNQENMDGQTEGQSTKSDTSEDSDKHRGKYKKNRNHSPTTKSVSGTRSGHKPAETKFYAPLATYTKLELSASELYCRLLPYVLMHEQLESNGFPLESDINPGKVYFGNTSRFFMSNDPSERYCSRCNKPFKVSEDGIYHSDSVCEYHTGRRESINGISGAGPYSCCGRPITSNGCVTSQHHVSGQVCFNNARFVKTREKRQSISSSYGIYGLDCEMCYTNQGLEVTRISVVGTDGLPVYDTYVLPENPIIDYNTTYSGITANHLKNVKTTLADAQAFLLKLLTVNTILVGHGLENDLKALRLIHPTIVDTSVLFPHNHGPPYKRSLKSLASSYLNRTIQQGPCGHDSVEDARTCIELILSKVHSDNDIYTRSHLRLTQLTAIPSAPRWPSRPLSINPVMVPYSMGYWVPPVGASCDLY